MKLAKKKLEVPEFNTVEEEAEFWETHSPFDYNMRLEKVKVKVPKDRPITIRLDSESRKKLEQIATTYTMGPSTFARRIIDVAIRRLGQKTTKPLTIDEALKLIDTLTPKELEDKTKNFLEENPDMAQAFEKNPQAMENFAKEAIAFVLRVGGLLKASGFAIESHTQQSGEHPKEKITI